MAIKCNVCEKSIGRYDDYISCRGKCGGNYHITCVQISEVNYTIMKESGSIREWCCFNCEKFITSINQEEVIKIDEGNDLHIYIKQRIDSAIEKIINTTTINFKNEIEKLQTQNKYLLQEIKQLKAMITKNSSSKSWELPSKDVVKIAKTNNINKQIPKQQTQSQTPTEKNLSKEMITNKTDLSQTKKITDTENINFTYAGALKNNFTSVKTNCTVENDAAEFIPVVRRQKRNSNLNITHGTATNTELKGVMRYAHLHVYGLDPNTTDNNINNYLAANGIANTKSEKLKAKHPDEYSSYKVSVPFEKLNEAIKPELWPSGVRVNRFLEQIWRKTRQEI